MAKQKNPHKQNHVIINPDDHRFLNRKEPFDIEEFEYDSVKVPDEFAEVLIDYLNRLRIEYIALSYNGEPKRKYKESVREKINYKKDEKLARKEYKADIVLKYTNMRLKDKQDG